MPRTLFAFVALGIVLLTCIHVQAAEKIKLQVTLTAGRDPNKNIIQDYGDLLWTDVIRQSFNKENPNVDVEFTTASLDKVVTMMAGGVGPDIINGCCSGFRNLGVQGAFLDLTPSIGKVLPNYMSQQIFWPPQWEAFQANGRQFALPQYLGTIAIYYNVDAFDAAGVAAPSAELSKNNTGWDAFREIGRRLTRDKNGDGTIDQWGFIKGMSGDRIGYWMQAAGAEFYAGNDRSQSALNSPQAVAALDYLQSLRLQSRVIPPPGQWGSFEQQTAVMLEDGSWRLVDFLGVQKSGAPKLPFKWDVFPLPQGPARRATLATIDGYAINKQTKYPNEALKLLGFLASQEGNEILARYIGLQPANRFVVPQYIQLMRQLNRGVRDVQVQVFTDAGPYALPQYVYSNQELADSVLNGAYYQIFEQQKPPKSIMEEAVERLNRTLVALSQPQRAEPPQTLRWAGATWTSQDVGTVLSGKAAVRGDRLVVSGEGKDIWGTQDFFRYTHQKMRGDFTATVALHFAPDTNGWSKAGIMVRASVEGPSPHAMVVGTGSNGLQLQWRPKQAEESKGAGGGAWTNPSKVYLRLIRKGNDVRALRSDDGKAWKEFAKATVDLPEEALIGVAVTSHAYAVLGDAEFSEWELEKGAR